MNRIASEEILINCSARNVFRFVSNMENFAAWFPGVIAIASADDKPHGVVGKLYLETLKVPLRGQRKIKLEVVESVPDSRFVTEGRFPPLMPRMEIEITATSANTTRVGWTMYSRNERALFRLLMLPLVKSILPGRARQGIHRLKTLLEQTG